MIKMKIKIINYELCKGLSEKFPNLKMVYIDCEALQEVCAQYGVFSPPMVQVFFMGQKFIEEVRGFSLLALEQKIEQVFTKMNR